ncbi:hypothetical protein [Leptospira idonii]|nr:hypothetical protein [Leptospira idonii]
MFSPQSSLLVSLLSGVGLLAVVSLAPVKSYDSMDVPFPLGSKNQPASLFAKGNGSLPSSQEISFHSREKDTTSSPNEFSLRAPIAELMLREKGNWADGILPAESEALSANIRNRTDWDLYSNRPGERKVFFQKDGLVMKGVSNYSLSGLYPSSYFRREGSYMDRFGNRRFDSYELQYPITSNIGAVVQSGGYDHFDDRSREQRSVAMAGFSVKTGNFFSAKVLTGDASYSYTPTSNMNYNPLNPNRSTDISRRDRDDIRQMYEWQASFTPSDYFKVQTSLYNQRTENSLNLSSPDGGKVSLFMGSKTVQMNVRYNYMTNRNTAAGQTSQVFNPTQDLASLGVVVFLDPSQRYSLYLGNNFYNVLNDPTNQVKDASGKSPTTFTASIRGKNPSASRSSFFLNFQNQFYKDGSVLGMPGVVPLGMQQGKSFYEYATSLGLELAF